MTSTLPNVGTEALTSSKTPPTLHTSCLTPSSQVRRQPRIQGRTSKQKSSFYLNAPRLLLNCKEFFFSWSNRGVEQNLMFFFIFPLLSFLHLTVRLSPVCTWQAIFSLFQRPQTGHRRQLWNPCVFLIEPLWPLKSSNVTRTIVLESKRSKSEYEIAFLLHKYDGGGLLELNPLLGQLSGIATVWTCAPNYNRPKSSMMSSLLGPYWQSGVFNLFKMTHRRMQQMQTKLLRNDDKIS